MMDVEKSKLIEESRKNSKDEQLKKRVARLNPTMSCHERLSHAIEVDKIKIYPNKDMVIEKTKKRNITETHHERTS